MKTILVVEGIDSWLQSWKIALQGQVELIVARSIEEVDAVFHPGRVFDAIVVDACVRSIKTNTVPLVKQLRAKFAGPIIATCGFSLFRRELVVAGCNHDCDKESVPSKLREVLGLPK